MPDHLRVRPISSATPGLAPRADELSVGELALNTADRRLFVKDADGRVVQLCEAQAQGTDFGKFVGGAPFALDLSLSCDQQGVSALWGVAVPDCSSQTAAALALEGAGSDGAWRRFGEYALEDAPSLLDLSADVVRGVLLGADGAVLARSSAVSVPYCPPVTTYNCSGAACYPVAGSSGQYATLAQCQAACVTSYNCVAGQCQTVAGASGAYATLAACQAACTSTSYNCVAGQCREVFGSGGTYPTLAACQAANCGSQASRYYCESHACRQVGEFNAIDGRYATSDGCANASALPRTVFITNGEPVGIVLPCRTLAVRITATGTVQLGGSNVGPGGYDAPAGTGYGQCSVLRPNYGALVGRFTSTDSWQIIGPFSAIAVPQSMYQDSLGYHTLWLRLDWYCEALPGGFTVTIEEGTYQNNPAP